MERGLPVGIFFSLLMAGVLFCVGELLGRDRKKWERFPKRSLNEPGNELAWFTGSVCAITELTSPLMRRASVYYSMSVEVFDFAVPHLSTMDRPDAPWQWFTAFQRDSREEFVLRDDRGEVLVPWSKSVQVTLMPDLEVRLKKAPPQLLRRIEAAGMLDLAKLIPKRSKACESLIAVGDVISVLGKLESASASLGKARLEAHAVWSSAWRERHLRAERRARIALRSASVTCVGIAAIGGLLLATS